MQTECPIPLTTADSMPCTACKRTFALQRIPAFSRVFCSNCGAEQVAAGQLGAYLVLAPLGHGGMGAVFRGLDQALDRPVAIKVLAASAANGPDALEQFRREAKAAAQISHINVARIFAFGIEHRQPYIVMEFVKGQSLMAAIDEMGPLDVPFALHVGIQTAEGLAAAAASGLVHGDVKPENILLDRDGTAKLIDFGLASLANQPGSREIWGTPYYISPERLTPGHQIDFRSDLYSLGGTMYHALIGKPPFDGESPAEVAKARLKIVPRSVAERRPSVDPDVSRIVMRALQREPANRYPSYDSMVGDMRRAIDKLGGYSRRKKRSGLLASARQTSSVAMPPEKTHRQPSIVPILVAGIALLFVGGAAVFFLSQKALPTYPRPPPVGTTTNQTADVAGNSSTNMTPQEQASPIPAVSQRPAVPSANVTLFAWRDEATTEPNCPVMIDVLANDAHPDGVAPEIASVTAPHHGKATLTSTGKVAYQPEPDYEGTDSFSYTIRHSSGKTAKATVTVNMVRKAAPPSQSETASGTGRLQIVLSPPAVSNNGPAATAVVASEPVWTNNPIRVRFSGDGLLPYASAKDDDAKSSHVILDGGRKIRLMGQSWHAVPIHYLVTTNTVLECIFSASRAGSVHAIGLDDQRKNMDEANLFQLYGGSQSRANRDYMNYGKYAPGEHGYRIPIGRYYTGRFSFLVVGYSEGSQGGDTTFDDIILHEVTNAPATVATVTNAPPAGTGKPPVVVKTPPTPAQSPTDHGLKATIRDAGKKEVLKTTVLSSLQFDAGQGNILGSGRSDNIDIEISGFITITQEGAYRFSVSADDSAELLIDDKSIAKAEMGKDQTSGEVPLTAGRHPLTIKFLERTGECYMRAKWIKPGKKTAENIPQSALSHTP